MAKGPRRTCWLVRSGSPARSANSTTRTRERCPDHGHAPCAGVHRRALKIVERAPASPLGWRRVAGFRAKNCDLHEVQIRRNSIPTVLERIKRWRKGKPNDEFVDVRRTLPCLWWSGVRLRSTAAVRSRANVPGRASSGTPTAVLTGGCSSFRISSRAVRKTPGLRARRIVLREVSFRGAIFIAPPSIARVPLGSLV